MQPANHLSTPSTPDLFLRHGLFRRLLVTCLSYCLGACGATSLLISFGFESATSHISLEYRVLVLFAIVPSLCLVDVFILWIQFRPIARFMHAIPTSATNAEPVEKAMQRARNFPVLTVFRIMCIHGPIALLALTVLNIEVGNVFFETGYTRFDMAIIWSALFVIVPAHAFLEYFTVQHIMDMAIPLMRTKAETAENGRRHNFWAIGIRSKLLMASVFITTVPLFVLGFTVALKFYDALSRPGGANEHLLLEPVVTWMAALTAFSTTITVSIAILLSRHIGRLTENLRSAMDQVQAGNFGVRLDIVSVDEFAQLYRGFNHMVAGLQERQRLQEAVERYISPLLADEIRKGGLQLGGIGVHATVLFSDIRGFTNLSEKLKAQEIVELLNRYFSAVSPSITRHGGWINKFGGDSILAVFGVPMAQLDHAQQAVSAALDMRSALAAFNAAQEKAGGPVLRIGIGLHSGWLVAGNMGSKDRMEYTVIGDAVNTASRLQNLTKVLGVDILISAEVYQATDKDLLAREMAPAEVQGKSTPLRIYALV